MIAGTAVAAVKAGAWTAMKQAVTTATWAAMAAVPLSMSAWAELLGIHNIAFLAALIATAARWFWFNLSMRDGIRAMVVVPVAAWLFAHVNPPFLDEIIGSMPDYERAMVLGGILGLFPTFVITFLQDFTAFFKKSRASSQDDAQ